MDTLFNGIFDSQTTTITVPQFLLCIFIALIAGAIISCAYAIKSEYTNSFVVTLTMLPAIVCVVIMMVNGNVGAGVAVAGAFSLVRFRSAPGTAKEIGTLFLAMGAGLIAGMGYLAYAILFALVLSIIMLLLNVLISGAKKPTKIKQLRITIPEDLEYNTIFNEVLEKYTSTFELTNVKTTNMGSMFKLTYRITLKDSALEKEFIDELRLRNGNLEISIGNAEAQTCEL